MLHKLDATLLDASILTPLRVYHSRRPISWLIPKMQYPVQGRNRVVVRYGISVPFFGAPKAPHPNCFFFYENWKDTEKNLETSITKNTLNKKK